MYNNLIEEDIMILDNEFFKIDTMFETVDRIYDIKMKELEYNYIYTENVDIEFVDLYTEAEVAKDKKEQGLLGRLFTAILNFIRSIRAKILRFFGNDKKASELEARIKGNPKLANQTVEITNTTDAEKAIDEGTSFFGSLIDKIVKGTATEADADAAEEKNKSLLSRIAIFGGGALLAAGGAKVASDKLKERGVTKQTIKETVSNLLKREEDTKKKAAKVTQENEQNVQKGDQSLKNNSQSGNEENTKAGRRIMGSFKGFITDVGKFFTGKASEIRSKINGVSSGDKDGKGSSKSSDNKFDFMDKDIEKNDVQMLRNRIGNIIYTSRDFSSGDFDAAIKYVESKGIKLKEPYNSKYELVLNKKDLSECTREDFAAAVFNLKENFCTERINEVKKIGKYMYGPGGKAKKNNDTKKDSTKDEQEEQIQPKTNTSEPSKTQKNEQDKPEDKAEKQSETSASKEQIKNTNTQQANDKQNQKNDNKQWNQSIEYRKDFAERLLKHESIDTIPTLKTELERIIKNGKYTDEEYKRMGEIEDRLQFEMILQKVYDDRDKLNSNDQKILDTLIKKINITANDDKELTILLNKVQDAKYNKKKRNKSNEQQISTSREQKNDKTKPEDKVEKQPETQTDKPEETQSKTKPENKVEKQPETSTTDTTEQKNGKNEQHTPPNKDEQDKSENKLSPNNAVEKSPKEKMDEEIENLMIKFHKYVYYSGRPIVLELTKRRIENGYSIVSMEDFYKINFSIDYKIKKSHSIVERAKIFLDSYKIYSKYKNPDKNKVKEALKNLYGDDYIDDCLDEEMDDIKTTFTTLDKYAKELNELIEKRKTFKESSYDLINDILTIFENSF